MVFSNYQHSENFCIINEQLLYYAVKAIQWSTINAH